MIRSPYDPAVLLERAALWRAEAAAASIEELRMFCLTEADLCERRVHQSRSTPVFRDLIEASAGEPVAPSPAIATPAVAGRQNDLQNTFKNHA
jgi:hypothetical protein